jgi:plasmid stabilization system protein ParE
MKHQIRLSQSAQRDLQRFAEYTADYSEEFSQEQFLRLNGVLNTDIAEMPHTWSYFFVTGAPYRAFLFNVGKRTGYWIVYTIDDAAKHVDVLRFWNASRDPAAFEV